MVTGDQSAVIAFLADACTHGGAEVERIDTHSAVVFLAGPVAYKLKRAVLFDYLDFSTPDRRRLMCEAEVRLNRRTAPTLYHGVLPVTREADGSLALGGRGEPVDWVVVMQRFPQDALFDRLAAAGRLDVSLMPALAAAVARCHASAETRPDHGGTAGMLWVIDGNAAGFADQGADILDAGGCEELTACARRELARCASLLEGRRAAGFVRHGHGDLHLRNIVLHEGAPTLFDCIEFDDRIACADVLYDLAFLLMDLWRRGLPRHANVVWNAYLSTAGVFDGLALLPLFLSCRAAVRAKTSATAARLQADTAARGELEALAREYLVMARAFLGPPGASLVAIGGLSGTGKSTVAFGVAPNVGPVPGAVVIRSDEIRKQMCGVPAAQRLGPEAYTAEMSVRVYDAILARAAVVVGQGHSAVVDAVFDRADERAAVERCARECGVPFAGLWLEAPEAVLVSRVAQRQHDASDADAAVVRLQQHRVTGAVAWPHVDASGSAADVLLAVRDRLPSRANSQ